MIFSINLFSGNRSLTLEGEKFYTQYATIDVLVVIYKNTANKTITEEEIAKLKNGINLSREFFWRNSGCQLNLNISYLEIEDYKSVTFFPVNGLLKPELIEQDLRSRGVKDNQYGIIVSVYSPPLGGGNYGGMKILDQTGYSFFRFPCRTSVRYPIDDPDTDCKATWLFTHEVQHSIDLVCYQGSNVPQMWHGDQPLDYSIDCGEQFSYQAEILRNFHYYQKIKPPWGRIDHARDKDGDHFPDHDPRVPIDEITFGSDTTAFDSDSDGLSDLEEFMAGIYRGSNPHSRDTDNDGIPDRDDKYPLHAISRKIPKFTPMFIDEWNTWYLVSSTLDHSSSKFYLDIPLNAKIYMNWDDNYLYFGCEMDAPAELHLDIDLLNNGWWHGRDNYRLVIDPFSDRFSDIRAMDCTDEARKLRKSLDNRYNEMWDDNPKYISRFGRILDEFTIDLKTNLSENRYTILIKIPNNDRVPFKLHKDQEIGLRVYFNTPELGGYIPWATVYEQYEFFDVILKQ